MWYNKQAENHFEALPVGNGRIGGLVFGGVTSEKIALNEDTLWSGYPRDTINYGAKDYLKSVRNCVFQKEYEQAQKIIKDNMLGCWNQSYMPLGELHLDFSHGDSVSNYKRGLDLEKAIAYVEYECDGIKYTRKIFTSYPDEVMVIELFCDKPGALSFNLSLSSLLKYKSSAKHNFVEINGICPDNVVPNYVIDSDNPVDYSKGFGMKFTSKAMVLGAKKSNIKKKGNYLQIENVTCCTIIYSSSNNYKMENYKYCCDKYIENARKLNDLKERHINDFQKLYNRVKFRLKGNVSNNLPTDKRIENFKDNTADLDLIRLYFDYGRYLLISSSRQGMPSNLQGIWSWEIQPAWSANYTTNINTQMNYWPSEVCNLPECHQILFDWIEGLVESGKKTAKEHYDARGFCIHHNVDIWNTTTPSAGEVKWAFWNMAGVWFCSHLFDHYLFSRKTEFLKNKALPIMHESVLFCLDILIFNKSGEFVTAISTSPENSYYYNSNNEIAVCEISAMDISLISELFTNYLSACDTLEINSSIYIEVEEKLKKLKKYSFGNNGNLLEWNEEVEECDVAHRHFSHLYGCYPSNILLRNKKLEHAANLAFYRRLNNGGGRVGWSNAWAVALAARFKDNETAEYYLNTLIAYSTSANLFDIYLLSEEQPKNRSKNYTDIDKNCIKYFQIDGNFGATAAIVEMLIQSFDNSIYLLPALPERWEAGEISGICAKGDITVSIEWEDRILKTVTIETGACFCESIPIWLCYKNTETQLNLKRNTKTYLTYSTACELSVERRNDNSIKVNA